MKKIVRVDGWRKGVQVISLVRAVRATIGSLTEAKVLVDKLLAGETIEIQLDSEYAAAALSAEMCELGANAKLVSTSD